MSWLCGWDGGGTKTEVLCADESGHALDRRTFGPLNLNGTSDETAAATIESAVGFMKTMPGGLSACRRLVIGAAGVSNARAAAFIREHLKKAGFDGCAIIVGDHVIALEGAIRGPGAVLIAGTGSVCLGRNGTEHHRVGGYGYLIDDDGSGYAIGRDILSAVVRAADGRGKTTALSQAVFRQLDVCDVRGLTTWLYAARTGKEQIAALAPLMHEALAAGDETAGFIARKAAGDLAHMALTAWDRLRLEEGHLALNGSVLAHFPSIRAEVTRICLAKYPAMRITAPLGDAAEGAILLAMHS